MKICLMGHVRASVSVRPRAINNEVTQQKKKKRINISVQVEPTYKHTIFVIKIHEKDVTV